MKQQYISHADQYIKTPAYSTFYAPYQKSKIYSSIKGNANSTNYTFCKNNKLPSLISMIGHDRLIDSLQNFGYNDKKRSNTNKQQTALDRFIPSRKYLQKNYKLKENQQNQENQDQKDPQSISIAEIYSDQVLGSKVIQAQSIQQYQNHNILKYKSSASKNYNPFSSQYQQTNSTSNSQINCQPFNKLRKISKIPCKVLDAPALQDDFYLNLIDWSIDNQLAVGLSNCIYLWNASNSKVTKLCQLQNNDLTSSVSWCNKGNIIAIGCNSGYVQIWDVNQGKMMRQMDGHEIRVGSMAWNANLLATGSRDKSILIRDLRVSRDHIYRLQEHTQQICGLKWSLDQQYLASGGNDNKVVIWSATGQILNKFSDHRAAVKAIAWSPHQHGLLATGGGTADRMIKLRNVFTGTIICEKDAGSQICNIAFSKSVHQIVSTHGYSQHEINVWSYPNMKKVATLIGHSHRVLYLSTSPDGSTIVTGAGDETLRFWNIFPPIDEKKRDKQDDMLAKMDLR